MNPGLPDAHPLTIGEMVLRLAIATLLGFAIGFERQRRGAAAGLQTSALVCVGAALFATIAPAFGVSDDLRILANIVTGVGFLAGGVILKDGMTVSGLNTAATMWVTAAIGTLAGVGLLAEATLGAAVVVALNYSMGRLADVLDERRRKQHETESRQKGHVSPAGFGVGE
jgi:putative Mg2+ transporter-C (MgtC) family protein